MFKFKNYHRSSRLCKPGNANNPCFVLFFQIEGYLFNTIYKFLNKFMLRPYTSIFNPNGDYGKPSKPHVLLLSGYDINVMRELYAGNVAPDATQLG